MNARSGARLGAVLAAMLGAIALPGGVTAKPSATTAAQHAAVPARFVGVNADGPIFPTPAAGVNLGGQLGAMVAAGIESVRVTFDWASAQPYASWSQVPAADRSDYTNEGGVPTDFAAMDEIVGLAAAHGLTVLPTVIYAPSWDTRGATPSGIGRPARDAPYASFVRRLVDRYGPDGSFWKEHGPKLPIRVWQIWNEPSLSFYWPKQPFAPTYVALLKTAAKAIRAADPGAKVMLAAFPNYAWDSLRTIYRVRGARTAFDIVGVHPYTAKPAGVIEILRNVRYIMNAHGDRAKPMIADEVSWTSSHGQTDQNSFGIDATPQGQAHKIAMLLPLLAADRSRLGLRAFYYYTWASTPAHNGPTFDFAGLLSYANGALSEKPAFSAFSSAALAMEHCRRMGRLAGRCSQPG